MPRAWYNTDRIRSVAKRIGVFFAVTVAFWIFSFVPQVALVFHAIEGATYNGGTLLSRAVSRVFAHEDSLSVQLSACTDRLGASVARSAVFEAEAREIEEWRVLLGYETRTAAQGVAARVIARDTPEESVVTIDRGSTSGVRAGSAVVIGDGALFGTIDTVSATFATVRLTEDPQSAIPGTLLGKERTLGLVSGQEGALLAMDYIPQDTSIALNDVVVTSGLGGRIAEGIVIGTVTDIVAVPSAPFIHASISPVHDAREWTAVLVLPYPEESL